MPILPNPYQCIWCRRREPQVNFDESHVLPNCLENDTQHILPMGLVCQPCNNYFGAKVEPVLLEDPLLHIRAVMLRLIDPGDAHAFRDQIFDTNHPSTEPVARALDLDIKINDGELTVGVAYTIRGQLSQAYPNRRLRLLSRAIHKIAFEWLAWDLYVKGIDDPVDIFSATFDPIRRWGREGQPMSTVRPVIRRLSTNIAPNWGIQTWRVDDEMVSEMNLFGDWYGVTLTSQPALARDELRKWIGQDSSEVWYIGEKLSTFDKMP